jgi:hypothetical protein
VVSEPGMTDAEAVPALLEQVDNPVEGAGADGMYDRRAVDEELERRGTHVVIPPRRDAVIQRQGTSAGLRLAGDEDLRRLRVGRKAWKEESGYHRRSLGETAMVRMKTLFGGGVSSRQMAQQATEVGIRCRVLNVMTHQGMPQSERVAA